MRFNNDEDAQNELKLQLLNYLKTKLQIKTVKCNEKKILKSTIVE